MYIAAARCLRRHWSPPSWALRWSRWKLISLAHGSQRATELFDLEADPGETTNLLPPHNVSGAGGQPPRASGEAASRHEARLARLSHAELLKIAASGVMQAESPLAVSALYRPGPTKP